MALSESLSVNSSLQRLDLSNSRITEQGICTIACKLPSFSIKELDVSGNEFSEFAAGRLAEGLSYNRTIENLGPIAKSSKSPVIGHHLDLNIGGRRALQHDIPMAIWPLLLARAGSIDLPAQDLEATGYGRNENVLYSLLRGPALFER